MRVDGYGAGVQFSGVGTGGRMINSEVDGGDQHLAVGDGIYVGDGAAPLVQGCSMRFTEIGIWYYGGAGGRLVGTTVEYCERCVLIDYRQSSADSDAPDNQLWQCAPEIGGDNTMEECDESYCGRGGVHVRRVGEGERTEEEVEETEEAELAAEELAAQEESEEADSSEWESDQGWTAKIVSDLGGNLKLVRRQQRWKREAGHELGWKAVKKRWMEEYPDEAVPIELTPGWQRQQRREEAEEEEMREICFGGPFHGMGKKRRKSKNNKKNNKKNKKKFFFKKNKKKFFLKKNKKQRKN